MNTYTERRIPYQTELKDIYKITQFPQNFNTDKSFERAYCINTIGTNKIYLTNDGPDNKIGTIHKKVGPEMEGTKRIINEVLAHKILKFLKVPTIEVSYKLFPTGGGLISSPYVRGTRPISDFCGTARGLDLVDLGAISDIIVVEKLINAQDRNAGNYLIQEIPGHKSKIIPIDFEFAFDLELGEKYLVHPNNNSLIYNLRKNKLLNKLHINNAIKQRITNLNLLVPELRKIAGSTYTEIPLNITKILQSKTIKDLLR